MYFQSGIKTVQLNCSAHSKNIIITIIIEDENVLQRMQTKIPGSSKFLKDFDEKRPILAF